MFNLKIRNKKLVEETIVNTILALMVLVPVAVGVVMFMISGQLTVGAAFAALTFGLIAYGFHKIG